MNRTIDIIQRQKGFYMPIIQPAYKSIPIGSQDDNKVKSDLEKPKKVKTTPNQNNMKIITTD
jgi:hypothetical protein